MPSTRMQEVLNRQLNAELYSSYLYLSMAAYFQDVGLLGFAHWMRLQAQEELMHGLKFYDYLAGCGARIRLAAIEAPPAEWESPRDAFENVARHEQKVTGLINSLYSLAADEQDHATKIFLQWFITEQVEEEATAGEVLQKLRLVGAEGGGLYLLDRELAARRLPSSGAGEEEEEEKD